MKFGKRTLIKISRLLILILFIAGIYFQTMNVDAEFMHSKNNGLKNETITVSDFAEYRIECSEQNTLIKDFVRISEGNSRQSETLRNDGISIGRTYGLMVSLIQMPHRAKTIHLVSDYDKSSTGVILRYIHAGDGGKGRQQI